MVCSLGRRILSASTMRFLSRPHPYHLCCRTSVIEDAEVKRSGLSVADRGEPEASCSAWHGDGTAGEADRASYLAAVAPAHAMGEAVQDDIRLVGKPLGRRGR
jgi:hypothetical protein